MSPLTLGMARARLGSAAALIDTRRHAAAACEENRLTRARQPGSSGPPELATQELLRYLGAPASSIATVAVVTENDMTDWAGDPRAVAVDGHDAHAAYAFHASGFDESVVLVCEVHMSRGWTAWRYRRGAPPEPIGEDIGDFPLARLYGQLTEALGRHQTRDEHHIEAMARAGRPAAGRRFADYIQASRDGVDVAPGFVEAIRTARTGVDAEQVTRDIAAAVQQRLGECLVTLLEALAAIEPRSDHLCLSGGLFFNTRFTTAATAGTFTHVFVPSHPGRNGTALGAALLAHGHTAWPSAAPWISSPYLGPSYSDGHIKEALDNCKLSYDLLREDRLFDDVLHALSRGRLVGWFHGRLEWGPRALGHRSVLADPFGAHTLDNLNGFLKQRPAYRTYGVSVPASAVHDLFEGPAASPFMQFEYRPRDPERFRAILPPGVQTLRVHTVDESEPRFLRLLELWGEKTGTPVLVNTSFNGFHEPLVCSPRDAIRVFYGTGLDVLCLENFFLRK